MIREIMLGAMSNLSDPSNPRFYRPERAPVSPIGPGQPGGPYLGTAKFAQDAHRIFDDARAWDAKVRDAELAEVRSIRRHVIAGAIAGLLISALVIWMIRR